MQQKKNASKNEQKKKHFFLPLQIINTLINNSMKEKKSNLKGRKQI